MVLCCLVAPENDANVNLSCANEKKNFCEYIDMFESEKVAIAYLAKGLETHYIWFYFFGSFIAGVGVLSLYTNYKILQLFPK